jgi:hypothetical protein
MGFASRSTPGFGVRCPLCRFELSRFGRATFEGEGTAEWRRTVGT